LKKLQQEVRGTRNRP